MYYEKWKIRAVDFDDVGHQAKSLYMIFFYVIYFYSDLVSYGTDNIESGMFDISGETFGSIFKHSKHLCKNFSTPVHTASEIWFQVLFLWFIIMRSI